MLHMLDLQVPLASGDPKASLDRWTPGLDGISGSPKVRGQGSGVMYFVVGAAVVCRILLRRISAQRLLIQTCV